MKRRPEIRITAEMVRESRVPLDLAAANATIPDMSRPLQKLSAALPPGPQHPRPDLRATPDGPGTDAAACWARLVRQWILPSLGDATIALSVDDLRAAFLEIFSAGGVHHASQLRGFVDTLAAHPGKAMMAIEAAYSRPDLVDTELEAPLDCSGMT